MAPTQQQNGTFFHSFFLGSPLPYLGTVKSQLALGQKRQPCHHLHHHHSRCLGQSASWSCHSLVWRNPCLGGCRSVHPEAYTLQSPAQNTNIPNSLCRQLDMDATLKIRHLCPQHTYLSSFLSHFSYGLGSTVWSAPPRFPLREEESLLIIHALIRSYYKGTVWDRWTKPHLPCFLWVQ